MDNVIIKWPERAAAHPEGIVPYYKGGISSLRGSLVGQPEYIAEAISFLISDEAKFIVGAELTVDGGWTSF